MENKHAWVRRQSVGKSVQTHQVKTAEISGLGMIRTSYNLHNKLNEWLGKGRGSDTQHEPRAQKRKASVLEDGSQPELEWKTGSNRWNLYQREQYLSKVGSSHPTAASEKYNSISADEKNELKRKCKQTDAHAPTRHWLGQSRFGATKESIERAARINETNNLRQKLAGVTGIGTADTSTALVPQSQSTLMTAMNESLMNASNFLISNVMQECKNRLRLHRMQSSERKAQMQATIRAWRASTGASNVNYLNNVAPSLQPIIADLTPLASTSSTHKVRSDCIKSTRAAVCDHC